MVCFATKITKYLCCDLCFMTYYSGSIVIVVAEIVPEFWPQYFKLPIWQICNVVMLPF
jgi:hypothetical protein